MAYASWSVTSLEQPTLAKWNILGTNDAYFNTQVGANFSSGTTSTVWWEELGRTTLGSAGDTISITPIAARNFLTVIFHTFSTGGTIAPVLQFNGDTGANYSLTYSINSAASSFIGSQTSISVASSTSQGVQDGLFTISNFTAQRKLVAGKTLEDGNAGAAGGQTSIDVNGKWDNTAAQITRVDLKNAGAGDFAIGSQLIVLGHD